MIYGPSRSFRDVLEFFSFCFRRFQRVSEGFRDVSGFFRLVSESFMRFRLFQGHLRASQGASGTFKKASVCFRRFYYSFKCDLKYFGELQRISGRANGFKGVFRNVARCF